MLYISPILFTIGSWYPHQPQPSCAKTIKVGSFLLKYSLNFSISDAFELLTVLELLPHLVALLPSFFPKIKRIIIEAIKAVITIPIIIPLVVSLIPVLIGDSILVSSTFSLFTSFFVLTDFFSFSSTVLFFLFAIIILLSIVLHLYLL